MPSYPKHDCSVIKRRYVPLQIKNEDLPRYKRAAKKARIRLEVFAKEGEIFFTNDNRPATISFGSVLIHLFPKSGGLSQFWDLLN